MDPLTKWFVQKEIMQIHRVSKNTNYEKKPMSSNTFQCSYLNCAQVQCPAVPMSMIHLQVCTPAYEKQNVQ